MIIITIIIMIFNRYFRYITKLTSFNRYFRYNFIKILLTANETIITVIFAIKISENNRD